MSAIDKLKKEWESLGDNWHRKQVHEIIDQAVAIREKEICKQRGHDFTYLNKKGIFEDGSKKCRTCGLTENHKAIGFK